MERPPKKVTTSREWGAIFFAIAGVCVGFSSSCLFSFVGQIANGSALSYSQKSGTPISNESGEVIGMVLILAGSCVLAASGLVGASAIGATDEFESAKRWRAFWVVLLIALCLHGLGVLIMRM